MIIISSRTRNLAEPRRHFRSSAALNLNRILFDQDECTVESNGNLLAILREGDSRHSHAKEVLKVEPGRTLRCGIIDVGMTNAAVVQSRDDSAGIIKIDLGKKYALYKTPRPPVDIILATPRPARIEKLLTIMSCMGVGTIALIKANKVPKDYFGSQLFRKVSALKALLVDGLTQAEVDCSLPNVYLQQNSSRFIEHDIDRLFPQDQYHRFIAQPPLPPLEKFAVKPPITKRIFEYDLKAKPKIVVAIGPEGGWEMEEIDKYVGKGFHVINIGDRILRTDMAIQSMLGIAHEWMEAQARKNKSNSSRPAD